MGTIAFLFVVLVILAVIAMGSGRAQEIVNAKGADPVNVSNRDRAYVYELYCRFHDKEFSLYQIEGRQLSGEAKRRFGVKSGRLDDRTVFGKRLVGSDLLTSKRPGRYQLTNSGVELGKELSSATN